MFIKLCEETHTTGNSSHLMQCFLLENRDRQKTFIFFFSAELAMEFSKLMLITRLDDFRKEMRLIVESSDKDKDYFYR